MPQKVLFYKTEDEESVFLNAARQQLAQARDNCQIAQAMAELYSHAWRIDDEAEQWALSDWFEHYNIDYRWSHKTQKATIPPYSIANLEKRKSPLSKDY